MSKEIVDVKIKINGQYVPVHYITGWDAVEGRPPIVYDENYSGGPTTVVDQKLHVRGDITTEGRSFGAVWNDYAELFLKGEELNPGDVVVYNPDDNKVYRSNTVSDPLVIGVVSDTWGQLLGGDPNTSLNDNLLKYTPVGMAGRVSVKVDGLVSPGSLLVSSVDGQAKAISHDEARLGLVLGKSLTEKDDEGYVTMLIIGS